tara:strand:+ start:1941 stop:3356 length:1416 start_codon:yes stop_codon:yes gene_type:complete
LTLLDNIIIIFFFAGIMLFSIYQKRNIKNNNSYFLAGKSMHWFVVMLSIVATETSVLTFVGIPAISYSKANWNFLQVVFGYIFGRILVSYFFLPMYYKEGIVSIYQIIGFKFGKFNQKMASLTFLITRLFADGVRFLATAGIVSTITGWNLDFSILAIGIITIFYSSMGGLKTILWVDGFQFFIYLSCGLIAIFHILNQDVFYIAASNSFNYQKIYDNGFLEVLSGSVSFFSLQGVLMSVLAGALMSIGSHGIDYLMVQRVLSTKDISSARKAMIGSGVFVLIQFSIFLCVGTLILNGGFFNSSINSNNIFTQYIIDYIPSGLKGIMLAGALSAAMSSLSSSINSLASSTIIDIFEGKVNLNRSMLASVLWGALLTLFCMIFEYDPESSIIVLCLKIVSFTYGGLISLFIFARLDISFLKESIKVGYIFSILLLLVLAYFDISWEYFIGISIISNFLIACIIDLLIRRLEN